MSRPGYIDKRGSNKDRAVRRAWLLTEFNPELGPGRARCHLKLSTDCVGVVDEVTLRVDRIEPGGSYARHNIQPSCPACSDLQGGLLTLATMDELLDEYRCVRDQWETDFDLNCNRSYRPGVIEEERRRERRGGRREVTDWLEENPAPLFRDWLSAWHESRREQEHASRRDEAAS